MTRHAPISSVYAMAAGAPPTGHEVVERARAVRAEAWHVHGLVVVDPEDIGDDWLRQAVINEADRRYGRRRVRG